MLFPLLFVAAFARKGVLLNNNAQSLDVAIITFNGTSAPGAGYVPTSTAAGTLEYALPTETASTILTSSDGGHCYSINASYQNCDGQDLRNTASAEFTGLVITNGTDETIGLDGATGDATITGKIYTGDGSHGWISAGLLSADGPVLHSVSGTYSWYPTDPDGICECEAGEIGFAFNHVCSHCVLSA